MAAILLDRQPLHATHQGQREKAFTITGIRTAKQAADMRTAPAGAGSISAPLAAMAEAGRFQAAAARIPARARPPRYLRRRIAARGAKSVRNSYTITIANS